MERTPRRRAAAPSFVGNREHGRADALDDRNELDELGAQFIQFIPIIERVSASMLPVANEGWSGRSPPGRSLHPSSARPCSRLPTKDGANAPAESGRSTRLRAARSP